MSDELLGGDTEEDKTSYFSSEKKNQLESDISDINVASFLQRLRKLISEELQNTKIENTSYLVVAINLLLIMYLLLSVLGVVPSF